MRRNNARRAGFSLVEVIVAVAILLIGVAGIVQLFPPSLRASSDAALRGKAALLAQRKVEEVRRDADNGQQFVEAIRVLGQPTDPIPFVEDSRLTYRFSSTSLVVPDGQANGDPSDDPAVPRVIVSYAADFRSSADVIYELRFDR